MSIHPFVRLSSLLLAITASSMAWAQTQVTGTDYSISPGGDVTITLSTTGDEPVVSVFATDNPSRIVLDLAETTSGVGSDPVTVNTGSVTSFTTLSASGRTRVLVDLTKDAQFDYNVGAGNVTLTVAANGMAAEPAPAAAATPAGETMRNLGSYEVQTVDFRRGEEGQSRIIVGLDGEGASVAVNAGAGNLIVDVFNADLPEDLNQVLDVVDFATPVQIIDVSQRGEVTRLEMMVAGIFEHLAYQNGNDVVIEVSEVRGVAEEVEEVAFFEDRTYSGTRVTFNFQDIPVRSVLQLIADVSDLNIVVADNVTGNLTLRLTNVPWDQALDIILDARNLDKRENGNVIWIAPTADIAAREQELLQAAQDRRELEPLITTMITVSYASAADLKTLIEDAAASTESEGGLLSPRGSVSIDSRTNTLLVTDTAERVEAIQDLVAELDRAVRQVQIESRIVIATSDFSHELGVRFGVTALHQGSNILAVTGTSEGANILNPAINPRDDDLLDIPPLGSRYNVNLPTTNANAGSIGLSFLSGNWLIDLELSALEAEGEGEVISTPRVVTANQEEAYIQQGVEIPYEEATSSGAAAVQFKEAVLELRVTPLITPDNRIQLDLTVKQDTVGEIFETSRGGSVPSIDTRELSTSVLVNNGETVVLGGIFQDTTTRQEDKVPYLSSIPGVGALFRRRANTTQKRELLIFVSPTIVEDRPPVN
ncbi:MAG: type IV pilus secretin PilQ [Pseudomonadota bacterium]